MWDWICVRDKPLTTEYLTRSRVFSPLLGTTPSATLSVGPSAASVEPPSSAASRPSGSAGPLSAPPSGAPPSVSVGPLAHTIWARELLAPHHLQSLECSLPHLIPCLEPLVLPQPCCGRVPLYHGSRSLSRLALRYHAKLFTHKPGRYGAPLLLEPKRRVAQGMH